MGRSLVTSTALPPIDGRRLATTMTLMLATTDDGDDDLHCMPIIYSHRPCRHSTHSHHTHTQHIGIGFASLSIPLCHFARSAVGEYYMILCVVCCSVVYLVVRFGPKLNFKGSGRIPSSVFGHIYIYIYLLQLVAVDPCLSSTSNRNTLLWLRFFIYSTTSVPTLKAREKKRASGRGHEPHYKHAYPAAVSKLITNTSASYS